MRLDHRREPEVKLAQPFAEGIVLPWMDRAARHIGEAGPLGVENTPAEMAQAGIDAENTGGLRHGGPLDPRGRGQSAPYTRFVRATALGPAHASILATSASETSKFA